MGFADWGSSGRATALRLHTGGRGGDRRQPAIGGPGWDELVDGVD